MSYATAEDMVARFDESLLRDLCSDGDTPVVDLAGSAKMVAALATGAGKIEAAVYVSNNYTPAELATLTGNSLALLVDLNCGLAMGTLLRRRPGRAADDVQKAIIEEANEMLEQIRSGTRLFTLEVHAESGLPTIGGPTAVDYSRLNMITSRTRNFYPSVASRLPTDR